MNIRVISITLHQDHDHDIQAVVDDYHYHRKITRWQFNTSTELRPLPSSDVFTDADMSVAAYIPMVDKITTTMTEHAPFHVKKEMLEKC